MDKGETLLIDTKRNVISLADHEKLVFIKQKREYLSWYWWIIALLVFIPIVFVLFFIYNDNYVLKKISDVPYEVKELSVDEKEFLRLSSLGLIIKED